MYIANSLGMAMNRYIFFLAAFILCAPFYTAAAPVQDTDSMVEEPENADSMAPEPPEKKPSKNKRIKQQEEKIKAMPPGEKPGDALEAGFNSVVLQGLNKVTAHSSKIETVIGSSVRFGTLEIIPRSCWQSAPGDRPENAVLLEIYEIKQGEPPEKIFLGWMFSSSPGLSSLEHPFYDIMVVKCGKIEGGKL